MSQLPPIPPDQPVPFKLIGKLSGWSSKAQHYPIFSQTWFSYRIRGFAIPVCLILSLLTLITFSAPTADDPLRIRLAVVSFGVAILIALVLGRWLAVKVRTQSRLHNWSKKKEVIGISIALLIGISVAAIPMQFSVKKNRPITIADESKKIATAPAVTVLTDQKRIPQKQENGFHYDSSYQDLINFIFSTLLLLWLGGGYDLLAYLRQRRALEEALLLEEFDRYKSERNQAEMRLSVLASQVEPHFLFNTLSGVRAAMLSDPARGVIIIDHLVEYLRSTIPKMRSDGSSTQTTLRNQFDSVRAYLGVIHVRMPRLSFEVDSPAELLDLVVPPLMLISLVENAVKHGIEPKKGPVKISVSARKMMVEDKERLELCVKDNGVGFGGASSGSGIGLSNIRERLKQLYGADASLSLIAGIDGGVEASIYLPIVRFRENNELQTT
jgi:signal transduction histidine kinase